MAHLILQMLAAIAVNYGLFLKMLKRKRIIFFAGCTVFALHFFFTFIYSFPALAKNRMLAGATRHYMYPVFNQYWKIFAPDPPLASQKLMYNATFSDSTTSGWIDPGAALLQQHYANRFWNYGARYSIYAAIEREAETGKDSLAMAYFFSDCRQRFPGKKIVVLACRCVAVPVPSLGKSDTSVQPVINSYSRKELHENN